MAAALALFGAPDLSALRAAMIPLIAIASLATLGIIQVVPIPTPLLRSLSPESLRIYEEASNVPRQRGVTALPDPRISIAPLETRRIILLTLSYTAIFVASTLVLSNRRRRRWFSA